MQKTNIFKNKKTPAIILTILIFIILFLIIINPAKYTNVCFNAILVWAKVLLPCLLPFFIFTNLISKLNVAKDISSTFMPFTKKMYNVPPISSYAFFMSIITGYPVGSKIVSDLYYKGEISKSDAKKIVSFTSNSGPMFIIGSVGVGLFIDAKIGYIIMISHLVGAILNGLLYRNIKQDNRPNQYSCRKYHS